MSPTLRRAMALTTATAALAVAAPAAGSTTAEVLDIVVLPERTVPAGPRLAELSGLAWDPRARLLLAVSDRGALFAFGLDIQHGRLAVALVSSVELRGDRRINAESVAVDAPGAGDDALLLVADERGHDLAVVGIDGQLRHRLAYPAALQQRDRLKAANSGVEAIVRHPRHGVLVVPQRPLGGEPPGLHRLFADDGSSWSLKAHPAGRSSLKAADLPDARQLYLLEKVKTDDGALRWFIRLVDLGACSGSPSCEAEAVAVSDPRLDAGLNFEGLACIAADLCLLVNDGGPTPGAPTWLVLLRLTRR